MNDMPKRLHASLYSDNKDWYDKGEGSEHMKRQIAEAGEPTKLQVDYTFEKMQNEIDLLTAERDKWRDAYEEDDIRTNGLCEKVNRLTAELKAKDEILRELLAYAEEGLLIDEHLAAHIVQALKGGGLAKKQ